MCMFSPIGTDVGNNTGDISFLSYIIKEKDVDKKIMQDDLLKKLN